MRSVYWFPSAVEHMRCLSNDVYRKFWMYACMHECTCIWLFAFVWYSNCLLCYSSSGAPWTAITEGNLIPCSDTLFCSHSLDSNVYSSSSSTWAVKRHNTSVRMRVYVCCCVKRCFWNNSVTIGCIFNHSNKIKRRVRLVYNATTTATSLHAFNICSKIRYSNHNESKLFDMNSWYNNIIINDNIIWKWFKY